MINAIVNGTGSYLPERVLTNQELETTLDTSHEWILSRSGISSRRIANEQETTSYMACRAGEQAIAASNIAANDLDLIIVATCTPDYFFPGVACHVQKQLKITRPIPAFDIGVACSGFTYAMDIARQYISSGSARHVLIIGSESMSRALDWNDRSTCVLFGDGAGAVILSASDKPDVGILGSVLHALHDENQLLIYPNYATQREKAFVSMCGSEIFKLAVKQMGDLVDEVLAVCHLQKSDINWLIPHQANIRIIQAIAKKLSLPMSQVIITIEHQGNTSAASIPIALDYSIREKRIKRGDILLLESFGGGMSWGANVLRY